MHGPCAPPPSCPEPLGDWGGAEALGALEDAYTDQTTNGSGILGCEDDVDGVPGITVDDTGLGGGDGGLGGGVTIDDSGLGGDDGLVTAILDIAGDVVLPATAAAAAATGIVGLAALGRIVSAINQHVKKVKSLDKRIVKLAQEAQDMLEDLRKVVRKGVEDEWLKGDIAKARSVLVKVEAYCEEMSKETFMKRYVTQSKKREMKVVGLVSEFESMRKNLTTVSVLELRRVVVDMMMPAVDRIEGRLENVAGALARSARASRENLAEAVSSTTTTTTKETTTKETTTKTKETTTKAKETATKSKAHLEKVHVSTEQEKQRRARPEGREGRQSGRAQSHSPAPSRKSQGDWEASYHQHAEAYVEQQFLSAGQRWDGYHQSRPGSPSSRSDGGCYSDDGYGRGPGGYPSSESGYYSDGGASTYSRRSSGKHPAAAAALEQARLIEEQAHRQAEAAERQGWETWNAAQQHAHSAREAGRQTREAAHARAQAMREKGRQTREAAQGVREEAARRAGGRAGPGVAEWREGNSFFSVVDNSVYDNSSVRYGDVVSVTSYNY